MTGDQRGQMAAEVEGGRGRQDWKIQQESGYLRKQIDRHPAILIYREVCCWVAVQPVFHLMYNQPLYPGL